MMGNNARSIFSLVMLLFVLGCAHPHKGMVLKMFVEQVHVDNSNFLVIDRFELPSDENELPSVRSETFMHSHHTVKLMDLNKKHAFDLFIIESEEEMHCYLEAVTAAIYDKDCTFLREPKRSRLHLKNYTHHSTEGSLSNWRDYNQTVVIDNTEFPPGGAYVYGPVEVLSKSYAVYTRNRTEEYIFYGLLGFTGILALVVSLLGCVVYRKGRDIRIASVKVNSLIGQSP